MDIALTFLTMVMEVTAIILMDIIIVILVVAITKDRRKGH